MNTVQVQQRKRQIGKVKKEERGRREFLLQSVPKQLQHRHSSVRRRTPHRYSTGSLQNLYHCYEKFLRGKENVTKEKW